MEVFSRFALKLWVLLSLTPAHAVCTLELSPPEARLARWRDSGFDVKADSSQVHIEVPGTRGLLMAWGSLSGQVLETAFYTRSPVLPFCHPGFSGAELFTFMLDHFAGRFRYLKSVWLRGSDNLNEFNRLTGEEGLSPEVAVLKTWSGRQGVRHGFTQAFIVDVSGRPGNYSKAVVYYARPGEPAPAPLPGLRPAVVLGIPWSSFQ